MSNKEAPAGTGHTPEARPKGVTLSVSSVLEETTTETTRERGECSGCGCKDRSLTAPERGLRGYTGPMYCQGCNPRFTATTPVEEAFYL